MEVKDGEFNENQTVSDHDQCNSDPGHSDNRPALCAGVPFLAYG